MKGYNFADMLFMMAGTLIACSPVIYVALV